MAEKKTTFIILHEIDSQDNKTVRERVFNIDHVIAILPCPTEWSEEAKKNKKNKGKEPPPITEILLNTGNSSRFVKCTEFYSDVLNMIYEGTNVDLAGLSIHAK